MVITSQEVPYVMVNVYSNITPTQIVLTNQAAPTASNFLRVQTIDTVRSSGVVVRELDLQILNPGGIYDKYFQMGTLAELWLGTKYDGSDAVKVFYGQCMEKKSSDVWGISPFMNLTFKDLTLILVNTYIYEPLIEPGGTYSTPNGNITINTVADAANYLLQKYNPNNFAINVAATPGSALPTNRVWYYVTLLNALQELASIVNYQVYVDPSKTINFIPRSSVPFTYKGNTIVFTTIPNGSDKTLDVESIVEDHDYSNQAAFVQAWCGNTIDGTAVVGSYRQGNVYSQIPGNAQNVITLNVNNQSIAPNAPGSTSSQRYANALQACSAFAYNQYLLNYASDQFLITSNHFYNNTSNGVTSVLDINNLCYVTSNNLGISASSPQKLKIIGINEHIEVKKAYQIQLTCTTNIAGLTAQVTD